MAEGALDSAGQRRAFGEGVATREGEGDLAGEVALRSFQRESAGVGAEGAVRLLHGEEGGG